MSKSKYYDFICPSCGRHYTLEERTYKKKISTGADCPHCIKSRNRKKQSEEFWSSITPEKKEMMINNLQTGVKEYRANATSEQKAITHNKRSAKTSAQMKKRWNDPEYKIKRAEQVRDQMNTRWKSMDSDKKKEIISSLHFGRDEYFANAPPEKLSERSHKLSESLTGKPNPHWASMTDAERAERVEKFLINVAKWRSNLSDDDRIKHGQLLSDIQRSLYKSLPEDRKEERREFLKQIFSDWYSSLSMDEKIQLSDKKSRSNKENWASLTPEQRSDRISKTMRGHSTTSLNTKFEKMFESSILYNKFYYVSEMVTSGVENEVSHAWDYGIFDNGDLVAVVDLDGEFYHADKCDYDGIHSKEEYDEKRGLSVPADVKIFIIREKTFSMDFKFLITNIISSYDEYLESVFRTCRSIDFPFPKYSKMELLKSWNSLISMPFDELHGNLSINTRIGDRLITHFHPSIYEAHTKGKPSPYEAWYNDELLRECIKNRTIYQSNLSYSKILQGFNISKIAPKVSVFSAGRAKIIISKYLSEFDTVFDPFAGFGGRMLGAISLGKRYIGQDISDRHIAENITMAEFLDILDMISLSEIDILSSRGQYPSLFTCPPYGDKEIWSTDNFTIKNCDDWIDVCLRNFNCQRYVFVVDTTTKYKSFVRDIIPNKSHFSNSTEMVLVINKEDLK